MKLGEWLDMVDLNQFIKINVYQEPHEKHYCTAEPCSTVLKDLRDKELEQVHISNSDYINVYLKEEVTVC